MAGIEDLYKKQIPMNARVVSGHGVAGKIDPTRAPIIGTGIGVGRGDSLKGAGSGDFNTPLIIGTGIGVGEADNPKSGT